MNSYIRFIVPVLAVVLTACGTTSDIKPDAAPVAGGAPTQNVKLTVDLSGYDKVVVLDFADATDTSKLKPDQLRSHNEMMATDLHHFSDLIARDIRDTGAYSDVVREASPGKALVISGRVTRLVEGNSALRLWIGMGREFLFRCRGQVVGFRNRQHLGQRDHRQQQLAARRRARVGADRPELPRTIGDQDRQSPARRQKESELCGRRARFDWGNPKRPVRGAHLKVLPAWHEELCDQRGPTALMRCSHAAAGVAMKVFVERDAILVVGVVL